MGACSSCLGRNRQSSKDIDETDPLLDESQVFGYGSSATLQVDEENLRREREAMDKITSEATENMVDVVNPHLLEAGRAFPPIGTQRSGRSDRSGKTSGSLVEVGEEEDEASWWQNIQSAGVANVTVVRGSNPSALAMDFHQLRDEPSKPAGKRAAKMPLTF